MANQKIKRIVLTGGPCAGKTTAIDETVRHFSELGYKVFTLPEVPTMFTKAGMNYLTKNLDYFYQGEKSTLEIQLMLEDQFYKMAQTLTKPAIIICDRGTLDISAYMTPDMWTDVTAKLGYTKENLLNRYEAIIHLRSTAAGLEKFYTTENNAQRYEKADAEGMQIARELDLKVEKAWNDHKNFVLIGNYDHFEDKVDAVLSAIKKVL